MDTYTTDTFFNGRIRVKQDRSGYRFSIDAVLLAGYASPSPGDRVLDLGTGCGIIPLILAYRNPQIAIYGVEVQKQLAELAKQNIKENRMEDRISIICRDMKDLKADMISGHVNLVVSNPPYRKNRSGRICANEQRAIARHEILVTLNDVVKTAGRMLNISGRFVTVYPAERMINMFDQMRICGIEPKYLRTVHSTSCDGAKLIIAEGVKRGRPGIKIGAPITIYNKNGTYTDEIKKIYGYDSEIVKFSNRL